jgi:hypothetical protein
MLGTTCVKRHMRPERSRYDNGMSAHVHNIPITWLLAPDIVSDTDHALLESIMPAMAGLLSWEFPEHTFSPKESRVSQI